MDEEKRVSTIRLSNKQKGALEKVTGKSWNSWNHEAIVAYFAFTDKGQTIEISKEAENDLYNLKFAHKFHPYTIEEWKEDFKKGLLFLWDFLGEDYSDAYIEHAFDIYYSIDNYIPTCYREHPRTPKRFRL